MNYSRPPKQRPGVLDRLRQRVIIPIIQRTRGVVQNLASGDQGWARFRLFVALGASFIVIIFLFILADTLFEVIPAPAPLPATLTPTITSTPTVTPEVSPTPSLTPTDTFIEDQIKKMPSRSRYLLAPFIAALIVFLYGARYIQDVYELKQFSTAFHYFMSSIFGFPRYFELLIIDGKQEETPDEENPLEVVGGPGYVVIAPGNVVLFARLTGPADVRPAGRHFISRFERISAIVSLEEQVGEIDCKATTKDGIPVVARHVRFRYRLYPGRRYSGPAGRAMVDPYPFSVKAILDMAYNRNVRPDGLMTWAAAINLIIDNAITGHIARSTFDQLISPAMVSQNPDGIMREIVQEALFSSRTRTQFRNFGAELLFCDIGHFAVRDDTHSDTEKSINQIIQEQKIANWKVYWVGMANKTRVDAEAQRQAFQELGRAEVQAEMLMSIAHGLEDAGFKDADGSLENLDKIILLRTAQIIDALSEQQEQKKK